MCCPLHSHFRVVDSSLQLLGEEHRWKVFENRVLRRIFGTSRDSSAKRLEKIAKRGAQ
jgi:hypothetical protein